MDVGRFAGQALECLPTPFLGLESVRTASGTEDLCIAWANPAAHDRFGSDLIGSWLDRDAPLGTTEPIVPETGPAGARIGLHTVDRSVRRDGSTEHLRCTLVPVGDGGAAMMIEDITAEAEAQADLASAGTTLARVEQWGNLGVWEVDLATNQTYWSTQVFQILAIDEAGPRQFRSVVHPDDLALVGHVVSRALDQPGPYRLTHRIVRPGGEVRTLDQHMQSIAGSDGRPARLMGTMIDVTATHALQSQVREAQSMRALGMLAGGLAHDFNNVLMIVRGHADLLLHQAADERTRASLEAISRAGERASTLTRKLMALGRQEALAPAPAEPATVLSEVAALVGPAVAPDVQVAVEIGPGTESVEIVVDVDHLNQLLIDLVLNARDANARHVWLRFATEKLLRDDERLEEGRLTPGTYGVVQVVDDGDGMDEATRQRIFEPFFTTKDASSGSGLGLANARSFAQRSLGVLHAESQPGTGTTMSLLLPVDVETETAPAAPPRRRTQTRVLVVARDGVHGSMLAEDLASLGHQLVSVKSLRAMTFSLATEPIDLVVVDGAMLSGTAAPAIDHVPVLVVGDAPTDARYRSVGGDAGAVREAAQSLLGEV